MYVANDNDNDNNYHIVGFAIFKKNLRDVTTPPEAVYLLSRIIIHAFQENKYIYLFL